MNILKYTVKGILTCLNKFLFPKFNNDVCRHNPILILQCGLVQKFIGINRDVPWPVHWTSQVLSFEKIERGERTPGLAISCFIDGRNGIKIEENVLIGPRVSLISMNHEANNFYEYIYSGPITIKKNSWLGSNCIILPGVTLGEHTIVASGAVVTKSFPSPNQLLAGNPAKIIKRLDIYSSK